jgi:glycosyltransferase involved in cell wall biosynthesis
MNPLVSILIPAYNAEEWIADTIRSALGQTWPRKEIIVVDDGSTDQTLSVARKFASKEVAVVSQGNQGAAAARNKAYSICRGDYIQWLDADDLLAADKIARQVESLNGGSDRTLISGPWAYFMYRSHRAKFIPTPLWCNLSPLEWLVRKLDQNLFMQTATWLVSRELTDAAGAWDTRLMGDDDGEYFCRVILASDGIRFIPEARTLYRTPSTTNLSHVGTSDKKLAAHLLSMQLHVRYIRSLQDSDRVRSACLKYLQRWLVCFYPERPDMVHQLKQLAATMESKLEAPHLPWKYAWIQKVFGWTAAKQSQIYYNRLKLSSIRSWDKLLFQLNV